MRCVRSMGLAWAVVHPWSKGGGGLLQPLCDPDDLMMRPFWVCIVWH